MNQQQLQLQNVKERLTYSESYIDFLISNKKALKLPLNFFTKAAELRSNTI